MAAMTTAAAAFRATATSSAEALLDAILDTSDEAMITHDAARRVISWNAAAERLMGYRAHDAIGLACLELFAPHLRTAIEGVFDTVLAGARVSRMETEVRRNDGMPVPIWLSISPVNAPGTEEDGPVAVLVIRDITEQRVAQATLAETEARIRDSEALAHIGSWLWDLGTGVVQWSDEFHRMHAVDPLDFEGTFEAHLLAVHPRDRARVRAALERSVASGRPFEDHYAIVRADHAVRFVHARAQPMVGSAGDVVGLRGIAQDITDHADIATEVAPSGP